MRTPFLKEPLPAPWWAFIYTIHHKLWCELHYGPSWFRRLYRSAQYDTSGGIMLVGAAILLVYVAFFFTLRLLEWLLL